MSSFDESKKELRTRLNEADKLNIIANLIPSLAPCLNDAKWRGPCPNPAHSQKSGKAFRLFDDVSSSGGGICNTCGPFPDIVELMRFANGWGYAQVFSELRNYFGLSGGLSSKGSMSKPMPPRIVKPSNQEKWSKAREKLVSTTSRLHGLDSKEGRPVAAGYLLSRGVDVEKGLLCLRGQAKVSTSEKLYHEIEKGRFECVGQYPAIFVIYRSAEGVPVSYHRVYLNRGSNSKLKITASNGEPVDTKRSMPPCGRMSGGYMELNAHVGRGAMGISEGFETGLAFATLFRTYTRCASAGLKGAMGIPEETNVVLDLVDADIAGLRASDKLRERCLSRGVLYVPMYPPPVPGMKTPDWLDVLNHYGESRTEEFITKILGEKKETEGLF